MKVVEREKPGNFCAHHFATGRTLEGNGGEGLLAQRPCPDCSLWGNLSCPHGASAWDKGIPSSSFSPSRTCTPPSHKSSNLTARFHLSSLYFNLLPFLSIVSSRKLVVLQLEFSQGSSWASPIDKQSAPHVRGHIVNSDPRDMVISRHMNAPSPQRALRLPYCNLHKYTKTITKQNGQLREAWQYDKEER